MSFLGQTLLHRCFFDLQVWSRCLDCLEGNGGWLVPGTACSPYLTFFTGGLAGNKFGLRSTEGVRNSAYQSGSSVYGKLRSAEKSGISSGIRRINGFLFDVTCRAKGKSHFYGMPFSLSRSSRGHMALLVCMVIGDKS